MANKDLTAVQDSVWLIQSPQTVVEGTSITYTITFPFAAACSASAAKSYKGTTDTTTVNFPSGSDAQADNTCTLKPLTAMVGGETYVITITVTLDGQATQIWKHEVNCQKAEDAQ